MTYQIKDTLTLIGFIVFAQAAGIIGSLFTMSAIDGWYATLIRPELAPPNWVFGPVWITLYALMGIAAFLVWRKDRHLNKALILFVLQLVLNSLWSIIFFGMQALGAAFVEIVFLWLAVIATIIAFQKISRTAAWLLVPYILWVSFAAYLNFAFWTLNV